MKFRKRTLTPCRMHEKVATFVFCVETYTSLPFWRTRSTSQASVPAIFELSNGGRPNSKIVVFKNNQASRSNFDLKLCTVGDMYLYFRNMERTKNSYF